MKYEKILQLICISLTLASCSVKIANFEKYQKAPLLELETMSITLTAIHSLIGMCTTLTYVALREQIFWKTLKMMKIN